MFVIGGGVCFPQVVAVKYGGSAPCVDLLFPCLTLAE